MGGTVDEAMLNAEEALAGFVTMLEEEGRAIPAPSSVDDIDLGLGEMVAYVTLEVPVTGTV